jgi:hypothetical protein
MLGQKNAIEASGAKPSTGWELISGKSLYLETTSASVTGTPGQGVLYYAADGPHYTRPRKAACGMEHGKSWATLPALIGRKRLIILASNMISKATRPAIVNAATGQTRAKVRRIAAGHAENLAPLRQGPAEDLRPRRPRWSHSYFRPNLAALID